MPEPLRVVLDGSAIAPHRSGIGEYSHALARAILAREGEEVELSIYARGRIHRVRSSGELDAAVADVRDGEMFGLARQWSVPRLLRGRSADVYHSPDFLAPFLLRGTPLVVTIHDIVPIVHPAFLGRSKKVRLLPLYRRAVAAALRRAAAVITDSRFSRSELIAQFGAMAEGVRVVPLAPTLARSDAQLPPAVASRIDARGYLLSISRADPYKGIPLLLRAYGRLRASLAGQCPRLVVIGATDARYDHAAEARRLGLGEEVIFTGYLAAADVSAVLGRAIAFVFPSLYEGFGLPPLEAMAHGVPVVCSNRASLPEVVGDAALLFDPEKEDDFLSALNTIFSDGKLRSHLMQLGRARAATFAWARTAEATINIYRKAARGAHNIHASS